MELTNTINNEHMVDGINRVLKATIKAKYHCEQLLDSGKVDNEPRQLIEELAETHASHIPLLSDSVRYLGGAPASNYSPSGLSKFSSACFSLPHLVREEANLMDLCDDQIRRLTGSDEVAEKLNIVRDDVSFVYTRLARI